MEWNNDAQERQEKALFLENLRDALRSSHGYAVIRRLLEDSLLFMPAADPEGIALCVFFDNFFKDVEQADPEAALRLFADIRCIPIINHKQEQGT